MKAGDSQQDTLLDTTEVEEMKALDNNENNTEHVETDEHMNELSVHRKEVIKEMSECGDWHTLGKQLVASICIVFGHFWPPESVNHFFTTPNK